MALRLGMNMLLYTTAPDEKLFPVAEKLKGMGFDGLEWPLLPCDVATARKIKKFSEGAGLASTAVAVFGPGENPLSDDPKERQKALDVAREKIEVSAAMGAELLCGPLVQPLGQFTGKGPTPTEWSRCVEYLQKAGDEAAKHHLTLVVEYLNRFEIYFVNTAADAARLCRDVNHVSVKTMVDTFHANIEESSLYEAVKAAGPHLAHVHISENNRGIPGSSRSIPWDDFFLGLKETGYSGWLTIESFGEFLPDLAAAARIWRKLFDDVDAVPSKGIAFLRQNLEKHGLS